MSSNPTTTKKHSQNNIKLFWNTPQDNTKLFQDNIKLPQREMQGITKLSQKVLRDDTKCHLGATYQDIPRLPQGISHCFSGDKPMLVWSLYPKTPRPSPIRQIGESIPNLLAYTMVVLIQVPLHEPKRAWLKGYVNG